MKLLILTPYYDPEPFGIAVVATGLAAYMAERGWQTTVLSGLPKTPDWEIYPEYQGKLLNREKHGRVDVVRTWVYCPRRPKSGRMKAWRRILSDTSMGLGPLAAAGGMERPDVIFAISPPLQSAAAAIALKRLWKCPLITWVQDIVPDAAVNVGMMQEGLAVRLGRGLERFVYEGSDHLAVISDGFAANLRAKGVPEAKLLSLTNWTDIDAFRAPSRRDEFRERLGLREDDFVLMHAGSMAMKQDLENVIRAMRCLSGRPNFKMLFLGDGIRKSSLQTEALGLDSVRFLSTAALMDFPDMLRAADLLVINQAEAVVEAVAPSKLLNYMASGRPVIAAANERSEASLLVRKAECGVVVDPARPRAFAESVLALSGQPGECARLGSNGAEFVREHFAKEQVLERFQATLARIASATAPNPIPVGAVSAAEKSSKAA